MRYAAAGFSAALVVTIMTTADPVGATPVTAGRTGSYPPPAVALQPTPSVAVGPDHVVAIGLDRRVYSAAGDQPSLTALPGLPNDAVVETVAAGDRFSVVLTYDGRVFGIGANDDGQLTGSGNRSTLTELTGLPDDVSATDIAAGAAFTLVLGSDHVAYGTGANGHGELTGTLDRDTLTPLDSPTKDPVTAIAAGGEHTLIVAGQEAFGTGRGLEGELTGTSNSTTFVPIELPDDTAVADVAAGATSSYFLTSDGLVYATGGNEEGQLGTGVPGDGHAAVRSTGLPATITHLSAAGHNVAALDSKGTPYVAGSDDHGQVGGAGDAATFRPVVLPAPVHQVTAGAATTVVRDRDGVLSGVGELSGTLAGQAFATRGTIGLSGIGGAGQVLTATTSGTTPSPTSTTYAWTRDGATRATGATLRLAAGDGGGLVSATVTLGRPGFVPVVLTSARVAVGLAVLSAPRLHGEAVARGRLRLRPGLWASGPIRLTVIWLRDGAPMAGQTGRRYDVRRRDVGHRIAALVTATRPGFASATARSPGTRIRPARP